MNGFRILCLFLALTTAPASAESLPAQTGDPASPESVLFVGNSFTFYNNAISTHLRQLLLNGTPRSESTWFLRTMTVSGAVLAEHRGGLEQMLGSRAWDVVVLQGHSREAIEPDMQASFSSATERFSGMVRDAGAEPVLFMTWAYSGRPEMTPLLDQAFSSLGSELGIRVVPVGLAFHQALEGNPDLSLHIDDGLHPTLEGTYLAAAVFYAVLWQRSPVDLVYDAGIDPQIARQLRQTAWRTVQAYESR
jgi:hypothetical protein